MCVGEDGELQPLSGAGLGGPVLVSGAGITPESSVQLAQGNVGESWLWDSGESAGKRQVGAVQAASGRASPWRS